MTDTLPRHESAPAARSGEAGPRSDRHLDCEICIVGDDVAARLLALNLARLGREVVRLPSPPDGELPLDPVLTPGFAMPARHLAQRLGDGDAARLLTLSREAVASGRDLAAALGLGVEAKGFLLAATGEEVPELEAEQAALERLCPGASRLVDWEDLEGLLGTRAFAEAIGFIPAVRLARDAFAQQLGKAEAQAGVRVLAPAGPPAFDLNGLRKYVDVTTEGSALRIRAFSVVLCGAVALRRGAPEFAANLVRRHFVAGQVVLASMPAFAGRVAAIAARGPVLQADRSGLTLAVGMPFPVWSHWMAGHLLRRAVRSVRLGEVAGAVVQARGHMVLGTRHLMPLAGSAEKGVWVAAGLALQPLSVAVMVAGLLADAITVQDDRITLLRPFMAPEPRHALASVRDVIAGTLAWRRKAPRPVAEAPRIAGGGLEPELMSADSQRRPARGGSVPEEAARSLGRAGGGTAPGVRSEPVAPPVRR